MNLSFTLCPASIAALPAKGRSAFVRAAIIKFGSPPSTSKGLPAAAPPALIQTPAVGPEVVPPAAVGPVKWSRSWNRPRRDFPDGFDMTTLVWDKARRVFLNSPPWPACPQLNMEQARSWSLYVDQWTFPDPFPGPLEWRSMGEPETPLPEHRMVVADVEPVVKSAPSQEPPLPVVTIAETPPPVAVLPGVGVSSNILEDV